MDEKINDVETKTGIITTCYKMFPKRYKQNKKFMLIYIANIIIFILLSVYSAL